MTDEELMEKLHGWNAVLAHRAADRIEELAQERDELQQTFDFQWRANMRAVEMWRKANPGNDLVLPDSAKLTVWLLDQLDATWNAAIRAAAKMADEGMDSHRAIAADIRTLLKP